MNEKKLALWLSAAAVGVWLLIILASVGVAVFAILVTSWLMP